MTDSSEAQAHSQSQGAILVSGLPRSGTSMMMQMLDAGGIPILADHVRGADEDNPKGYYELEAVKRTRDDASWLQDAQGKAVKMIYALLPDLPETGNFKLIFMDRPLGEVIKSQAVMLQRRGQPGANLSPEKLASVFEREVGRIFDWLRKRADIQVHRVSYGDVLQDPATEAAKLREFLGIDIDVEAMAGVVDPDLYRQRVEGRK